jgi:predicted nucleic acid-binding Zn ribbon protein
MALRSIHHILGSLEHQENWQGRRQFQQLVASWVQVVGPIVAAQTRPVGIHRQVLQVATSSAVWAQNLAFERQRILAKLNPQVGLQLTDIRFSTAQWQPSRPLSLETAAAHPSQIFQVSIAAASHADWAVSDPQQVFQRWAEQIKLRSQLLPLCPVCRCPAPAGELERWSVCAPCATKRW